MRLLSQFSPVQFGLQEGLLILGIWNLVRSPAKGHKLLFSALGDHPAEFRVLVIGEVQERSRGAKLLSLEKHGHKWSCQHQRSGYFCPADAGLVADPLALGTVANLVIVLYETDEAMAGQAYNLATVVSPAMFRVVAVIDKYAVERLG